VGLNTCQDANMVQGFVNTYEKAIEDGIFASSKGQDDSCIKRYELCMTKDKHIIELTQQVTYLEKSKVSLSSP